jgi:hypothetical protein
VPFFSHTRFRFSLPKQQKQQFDSADWEMKKQLQQRGDQSKAKPKGLQ